MAARSSTPRRSTTPIRRTRSVSPARVRDIRKQLQEAKEKPEYVAKVKARANTPRRQAKPASGGAPPPLPARDDTKKLPAGWEAKMSAKTNSPYYLNTVTGESQTEFPIASATPDEAAGPPPVPAAAVPEVASEKKLPAGWETAVSRSSGDTYYVNTATGETTYDFPTDPAVAAPAPPPADPGAQAAGRARLPTGARELSGLLYGNWLDAATSQKVGDQFIAMDTAGRGALADAQLVALAEWVFARQVRATPGQAKRARASPPPTPAPRARVAPLRLLRERGGAAFSVNGAMHGAA